MKLKLSLSVLALFFIMQTSAFAISGQHVYKKYKQTEKKMEKNIKSMIMVIEMNTAGTIAETTVYKKGRKMRVESVIKQCSNPIMGKPGQKSISIDDGVTTTVFHPMMGKMSNPSEQEEEDRIPLKLAYLGNETISGINCHKIRADYQYGEKETLWISAKDFVLVKEDDGEGSTTINSDFRKVSGFPMPYLSQSYENGSVETTTKVKSVKRVNISNSKFDATKVKGFNSSSRQRKGANTQSLDQAGQMMNMMEMAMEIQRLHMNGETEKAEALTKKMQQMTQGQ